MLHLIRALVLSQNSSSPFPLSWSAKLKSFFSSLYLPYCYLFTSHVIQCISFNLGIIVIHIKPICDDDSSVSFAWNLYINIDIDFTLSVSSEPLSVYHFISVKDSQRWLPPMLFSLNPHLTLSDLEDLPNLQRFVICYSIIILSIVCQLICYAKFNVGSPYDLRNTLHSAGNLYLNSTPVTEFYFDPALQTIAEFTAR